MEDIFLGATNDVPDSVCMCDMYDRVLCLQPGARDSIMDLMRTCICILHIYIHSNFLACSVLRGISMGRGGMK